jgi:hypothetical protein
MARYLTGKPVKIEDGACEYVHRFGGNVLHEISGKDSKNLKIHCLYMLDCSDPDLPIKLKGRRLLPLYYPMFNNACDFSYEVISDKKIKVHLVSDSFETDFPYEGYPIVLPERKVRLRSLSYEQEKTLVYYYTAENRDAVDALSVQDKGMIANLGYPFTQIGGIQKMTQGTPETKCTNSKCKCFDSPIGMVVFAVVWNTPIPDFSIWGEVGEYSQIIFQICNKCQTIHVCNRSD